MPYVTECWAIVCDASLTRSASFEYLYYGCTAIINIFNLTVSESDVYRRLILTTEVAPCVVWVKHALIL